MRVSREGGGLPSIFQGPYKDPLKLHKNVIKGLDASEVGWIPSENRKMTFFACKNEKCFGGWTPLEKILDPRLVSLQ